MRDDDVRRSPEDRVTHRHNFGKLRNGPIGPLKLLLESFDLIIPGACWYFRLVSRALDVHAMNRV